MQINDWPHHGLQVLGTLTLRDVEPLVEAVRDRGATSIHLEELQSLDKDAAVTLADQLPLAVRFPGTLYVHVAMGPVAQALEDAGFTSESGGQRACQLVHV